MMQVDRYDWRLVTVSSSVWADRPGRRVAVMASAGDGFDSLDDEDDFDDEFDDDFEEEWDDLVDAEDEFDDDIDEPPVDDD